MTAPAPVLRAIGLMSGTSLDGVDAAIIETDGVGVTAFGPSLHIPYDPALRAALRALLDDAPHLPPDAPALRAAEDALTRRHAEAVLALMAHPDAGPIDLIGFHGQTILHDPAHRRTWQIGDATLLSRLCGLPVVHDFRSDDVAGGGQGAPLVPVYHAALLGGCRGRAILNVGGVANVTLIGPDGALHACDTGPGNALMDDWAMRHTGHPCDVDGALARAGRVDHAVLGRLLADPFFSRPAPKSLDRLTFHRVLADIAALSAQDGAATLTAFTAHAVRRTPLPAGVDAWFVCGGGRHNPALMDALAAALPGTVNPVEALGWDGDALEAQCFGFLAVRCLRRLPISWPGTTGIAAPATGGRLSIAGLPPPGWLAAGA